MHIFSGLFYVKLYLLHFLYHIETNCASHVLCCLFERLPEIYEIIPKSQIVEFDEDNTADSTEPVIVGSEAKLEPIESTKSENVTMPVESKEAADKPSAGTEGPAKPEEAVDAVNEPKEVVAAAETEV